MDGITTVIVAFCLFALAWQGLIKNRAQYYVALGAMVAVIFLDALAHAIGSDAFGRVVYMIDALLQLVAIAALVMSAGGLSIPQFAQEISNSFEVIRGGQDPQEVSRPMSPQARQGAAGADADAAIPPSPPQT